MDADAHITVLLHEACQALLPERGGLLVDGTFGRGGHSRELLRRMPPQGRLFAIDRDQAAAREAIRIDDPRFRFIASSFGQMDVALAEVGVTRVDGILLDIGVSSPQLDDAERGFSFMRDGPLDMRMDQSRGLTAAQWIAVAPADELTGVIREYGEERFAPRIAAAIVEARQREPVERTLQLAQIIEKAVPAKWTGQHPATKTFQAIRIHVNRELEELRMALNASLALLAPGGRLAVISFHSLEDRIVKQWMREQAGRTAPDPRLRHLPATGHQQVTANLRIVGKDLAPSAEEVTRNVRARSARLRVAERIVEGLS